MLQQTGKIKDHEPADVMGFIVRVGLPFLSEALKVVERHAEDIKHQIKESQDQFILEHFEKSNFCFDDKIEKLYDKFKPFIPSILEDSKAGEGEKRCGASDRQVLDAAELSFGGTSSTKLKEYETQI